jgi:adenylate cyclase
MEKRVIEQGGTTFFEPETLLEHAKDVVRRNSALPSYAAFYLRELLKNNGLEDADDRYVDQIRRLIEEIDKSDLSVDEQIDDMNKLVRQRDEALELQKAGREITFRKEIEEFYLPKQLIDAILENGEIPSSSQEQIIGIGFIDIADYTYLSKFLSPKENQMVLNGLYAAFNSVLKRHGGFLNKIEGDSVMFHFGGIIDPAVRELNHDETEMHIAKELFYTCVEMQRVAFLFNQANDRFLFDADDETRRSVKQAFDIIGALRTSHDLSQAINAFFQIRIRIGANIGEVTIGNFGPEGARQWDVIGEPVIKAKRMEATAPIGGFRISEDLYTILNKTGIADDYYRRFKREAEALFGAFRDITREELFQESMVKLKDKRNAEFNTYSIQVNPGLPEALKNQVSLLLQKGDEGADRIVGMLQYYRGNRFVINGLDDLFAKKGIKLRFEEIISYMMPVKYEQLIKKHDGDREAAQKELVDGKSLFQVFEILGTLQDIVKEDDIPEKPHIPFEGYRDYMKKIKEWMELESSFREKRTYQRSHFFHYVYPMVFISIRTSILEYEVKQKEEAAQEARQKAADTVEELDELEELVELDSPEGLEPVEELELVEELESVEELEPVEELESAETERAVDEPAVLEEPSEIEELEGELEEVE